MADLNEPKKETVRIAVPPVAAQPGSNGGDSHDTVRIAVPPAPPPAAAAAPSPQTPDAVSGAVRPPNFHPPPRPPLRPPPSPLASTTAGGAAPSPAPAMPPRPRVLPPTSRVRPALSSTAPLVSTPPANYPGSGGQSGPRKETARINLLPEPTPVAAPTVKMTKTQPLLNVPLPAAATQRFAQSTITPLPAAGPAARRHQIDEIPMPLLWAACGISAVALIIQIWNYFVS